MRECDIRSAPMKRIMIGLCRVSLSLSFSVLLRADIMNTFCPPSSSPLFANRDFRNMKLLRWWHRTAHRRNHNMSHAMRGGKGRRGRERGTEAECSKQEGVQLGRYRQSVSQSVSPGFSFTVELNEQNPIARKRL